MPSLAQLCTQAFHFRPSLTACVCCVPAVDRHVLIEVAATDQSGAGIMDEKVLPPDELVDTRESITGLTIDDFAGAFLLVAVPFVLFAFCLVCGE